MRKFAAAVALVASALGLAFASTAFAAATPKATGGVGLSPTQYLEFNAFDYGPSAKDKGTVNYTNFDYHEAGSNVWDVRGTYPVTFNAGGTDYPHQVTIDSITPTSTTSYTFSGSGHYVTDPSYTWTVTGTVSGSSITFDVVYTGTGAGYTVHGTGTIAPDGSISGNATDSNGTPLTFSTPAGSVREVLSYTASVVCAHVAGNKASFAYVIPSSSPSLAGTQITFTVTDGGSPAVGNDTVVFDIGRTNCDGSDATQNPQTPTSGNLVVH